ncbi:hypothetical protein SAMN05421505_111108 [Sinosporangium album]|uniref:Uncharacterized protein n=1 Tax=Sinosporangium album TaxID=504805 RepID=A0A1G7ZLV8_9ACTN|nr:hypothetical protein SAMN05421505_111108 [Sinosporangium album]
MAKTTRESLVASLARVTGTAAAMPTTTGRVC